MREYWFDEDGEVDVKRMTDEQLVEALAFLLETAGEKGGYSRKTEQ
jgi:hypothetical protein